MELQSITHFTDQYSYYDSARMALEGGCRWIQLRMKDATPDEIRPASVYKLYAGNMVRPSSSTIM